MMDCGIYVCMLTRLFGLAIIFVLLSTFVILQIFKLKHEHQLFVHLIFMIEVFIEKIEHGHRNILKIHVYELFIYIYKAYAISNIKVASFTSKYVIIFLLKHKRMNSSLISGGAL